MDITCNSDQFILIGWSHYGTKKSSELRSLIKQDQKQRYKSYLNIFLLLIRLTI
jgi:hypothetical protein